MSLPPIIQPSSNFNQEPVNISGIDKFESSSNYSPSSLQQQPSHTSVLSPTASYDNNNNQFNRIASPPNSKPSAPSFASATYGDMFGATIHFWLESIVARCRCDRVALFLPHPRHHTLVRVALVGPTAQPVTAQNSASALYSQRNGDTPASAGPVTSAVLQTGIAANLSQVAQEDALDCPGTTVAKNALIIPIKPLKQSSLSSSSSSSFSTTAAMDDGTLMNAVSVGVLFAVNKLGGSQVFSTNDQYVLVSVAPSIAYMAETYPVDFAAHRFDPSPLHRVISLSRNKNNNSNLFDQNNNNNNTTSSRRNNNNNNNNNNNKSLLQKKKNAKIGDKNHDENVIDDDADEVDDDENEGDGEPGHEQSELEKKKKRQRRKEKEESTQANLILPEKPPQLIFDQSGAETMLPYVAMALEEKTRENYNNAVINIKNKKSNNNNIIIGNDKAIQPVVVNTPEDEKKRIFDQSKATLEELTLHQQMQHENGRNSSSSAATNGGMASPSATSLSTAQQILSIGEFVNRMEQCWRDAVSRTIATERELTLRNAQVVDAHSILHRKQRRLEILKDVLVESLEKKL